MLLKTADELLDKMANGGGVVVCTNALTALGIAEARACDRMYVTEKGIGYVWLPNCVAHPNLPDPQGCGL